MRSLLKGKLKLSQLVVLAVCIKSVLCQHGVQSEVSRTTALLSFDPSLGWNSVVECLS